MNIPWRNDIYWDIDRKPFRLDHSQVVSPFLTNYWTDLGIWPCKEFFSPKNFNLLHTDNKPETVDEFDPVGAFAAPPQISTNSITNKEPDKQCVLLKKLVKVFFFIKLLEEIQWSLFLRSFKVKHGRFFNEKLPLTISTLISVFTVIFQWRVTIIKKMMWWSLIYRPKESTHLLYYLDSHPWQRCTFIIDL